MAEKEYNVAWLAKKLDREAASIRVALRSLEIDINKEGVYAWKTLAEAEKVLQKLRDRSERAPASDKKPAKKKSAKKAKKKAAKKKPAADE